MVRALKYPLQADSAIFWGDDAIQAFNFHGNIISIESEADVLRKADYPRFCHGLRGIPVMVACDILHTLGESEAKVQAHW